MLNRYTLPLLSALVVSASLASCQRKAEEATTPAEEIVFTVASSSQTKSCAAETSPVSIPVKSDGGEELTLEVSSCPWMVEEPSTPATKVVPLDGSYFSDWHNSFGVMTYSAPSGYAAAASRTPSWTDEVEYNGGIWAPSPSQAWPFAGNYLMFFGWAPHDAVTPVDNNNNGFPTISDFTVNENAANQVDLLVSKVVRTDSPLLSAPVPITFGHALTAVRFIGVRLTINSVTISGIYDQGSFNMDTGVWSDLGRIQGRSYSSGSYVTDEEYTLMLIPQTLPPGATLTAVTSAGTITASLAGQVWDPGRVVTYKITDPGTSFSVSYTQKVRFSPGNLQAVFADAGTSFTWKFADNQWDYIGGRMEYGSETKTGNNFIVGNGSVSTAGTVDLFGWSTNVTTYGINDSKEDSAYSGDFVDWGSDSNLASALGSGWRTLSSDEWAYLLEWRGGGSSDYPRYCKAAVNDVPGLVIFPDGFYDLSVYFNINGVNTPGAGFSSNSWSGDVWTTMESAGCVFLPVAGDRVGTYVGVVGTHGIYWSSTRNGGGNDTADILIFTSSFVSSDGGTNRHVGISVRLVQYL